MSLLPSANYFQKSMGVYVRKDDHCTRSAKFISTTCLQWALMMTISLQTSVRCFKDAVEKRNSKLMIGKDKVPFVGHDIDNGINMSQTRIEGGNSVHDTTDYEGTIIVSRPYTGSFSHCPSPISARSRSN